MEDQSSTNQVAGRQKQKAERDRRKNELLTILNNGGPVRYREVRNIIGSSALVKELIDDGVIERLPLGLYALPHFDNSWQSLAVLSVTVPNAVVCMTTAAAYHGLTTANPHEVHLAIPRDQSVPKNSEITVKGYRWMENSLKVGVEEVEVGNTKILMTNPARTTVDLLRSLKKTAEIEMAMEALQTFKGRPAEILKIARALGCEKTIRPYTQAIQSLGRKP